MNIQLKDDEIIYKVGLTGNCYVFSKSKILITEIAIKIGKSLNSVYFNSKCLGIESKK